MTRRTPHLLWFLVATLVAPSFAATPEILRVRAPSTRADAWFPKGTELISVPIGEFNALLRKVEAVSPSPVEANRGIVAASHRARWDDGVLVGSSTFRVRRDPTRPIVAPMSPWGPSIDGAEGRDFQVRTDGSGRVSLWLASQGGDEVTIRWRQPAGPNSSGHLFRVELPRVVPMTLELDLPDTLRPAGADFDRVERPDAVKGRSEWRQTGRSGTSVIRLRGEGEERGGRPWISGPIGVDVSPGVARWRADWQVDPNGLDRPLIVELSPGLEPVDVAGPGVESSRFERKGDRTEVAIRFRPEVVGPTPVVLQGSAAIPAEGPWKVPAARPKDGVWTGGTVTVRVDAPLVVRSVRVLQGRRVAPTADAPVGRSPLVFEPTGTDPVAELSVEETPAFGTTEVRGLIRVEGTSASFVAEVRRAQSGRVGVSDLGFTLSPGWSIDRLTSGSDPLTWQQETPPDGPTRVRVTSPSAASGALLASLIVRATRSGQVGDRAFEVPRIGLGGQDPGDETWAAVIDGGRVFEPEGAAGLAWLAPTEALTPSLRPLVEPARLARALAWRWTGPGGRLAIVAAPEPREVDARLTGVATLADGRLRIDWRVSIRPGSRPITFIPLFVSNADTSINWKRPDGSPLPARGLTLAERSEAGFPADGSAFGIGLGEAHAGTVELVGVSESAWTPDADLPLLHLPDSYQSRSTLSIRVDRDRLTSLRSEAVHDLETEDTTPTLGADRYRTAHRIGYAGLDAKARVIVIGEAPVDPAAIVRSARLETRWYGTGIRADGLTMDVTWGGPGPIRFRPRPGARIVSFSIDGKPMAPAFDGPDALIPRPPGAERPQSRIVLEWQGPAERDSITPGLPGFSIPCLGLTWSVDLPPARTIAGVVGRLVSSRDHFEVRGWPDDGDRLRIEPAGRAMLRSIGLGFGILVFGLAVRLVAPRWRVRTMVATLAATAFVVGVGDRVPTSLAAGMVVGMLALWALNRTPVPPRSTPVASRSGVAVVALLALTLIGAQPEGPPDAILVLLPYDPTVGPETPPQSALMRLSDHARLLAIVETAETDLPGPVWAIEATHRLKVEGGSAAVESEYVLVLDRPKSGEWRIPTEGATGIEVTLDGRPHPCRMVEEGRAAVVVLADAGRHLLRIRRSVRVEDSRFEVAITPVPSARVAADRPIELQGEGPRIGSERLIGPSTTLGGTVREAGPVGGRASGLSGLVLWDARPAGDLVRLRLVPEGGDAVAEVRLAVEDGAEVRAAEPSRVVGSSRAGGTWTASFDPPIRGDRPVTIEVWRPRAPGGVSRRSIRVATGEGTRFSGVVALRRPSDWSGRLAPSEGLDTIDEASFARAWGALPADGGVLAGTSGFQSVLSAEVDCRLVVRPQAVRPVVRLEPGDGRLDVEVRGEWRSGPKEATGLDVSLPPDLTIEQVTADGLISVGRPGRGRLHLEFEGNGRATRSVIIRASMPVAADPLATTAGRFRARVPWPTWGEATEEAGVLTVGATRKPVLEHGPGVSPLAAAEPFAGGSGLPTFRKVFGVTRPADLGPIAWGSAPARVAVFLHSQLALTARTSELTSTIRYEIAGEPIDAFYLKIPTAWAADARVDLVGHATRPTFDARGAWTYITVRPDRPVWGAARLIVRAGRREVRGQLIRFPDISPLGQGSVDKTISVRKRTRLPIELEGSPGLQSVDVARIAEPRLSDVADTFAGAYRVTTDDWTLGIRVVDPSGAEGDPDRPVVATEGEWDAAIDAGGNLLGVATMAVEARRGGTLGLRLNAPGRMLWAAVDGRSVPVFATAPGRWEVPIDAPGTGRVELAWSGPGSIPAIEGAEGPTLGTVVADPPILVRPPGAYEPIDAAELALAHVDRLSRRIATKVAELDRSSPAQIAELRALLAEHEAASQRAAETQGAGPVVARVERSRATVRESLELNGLEDLEPSGRAAEARAISHAGPATYYRSRAGAASEGEAFALTRAERTPRGWWLGAIAAMIAMAVGPRLAARLGRVPS